MYYGGCSVGCGCFSKSDRDPQSFQDLFGIVDGIAAAKEYFFLRVVDIGPFEVFGHYPVLRDLVRQVSAVDFEPRLLTSGAHFENQMETQRQFAELASLGVTSIFLRLDGQTAASVPTENVANYANACTSSGIQCNLRFDLDMDGTVPEGLFRVARVIEEARFYTQIYTKAKLARDALRFNAKSPVSELGKRPFRVVIADNGEVAVRTHGSRTTEFCVGSLSSARLPDLIDPGRLNPSAATDGKEREHDA